MKETFDLKNMPISGSAASGSGGGAKPIASDTGSAKPPTGDKQTSGPASRARGGLNLAGKGENLNGFPTHN